MKKVSEIILVMLSIVTLLLSCNKQDENIKVLNNNETASSLVVNKNPSPYEWEESYNPYRSSTRSTLEQSVQISIVQGINPYVGGIFTKESVNTLTMEPINCQSKAIDITFDFPGDYFDRIEDPTHSAMFRAQRNAINSPDFSGQQLTSFAYDFKQMKKINEARLAFGANCDIKSILKINMDIAKNSMSNGSALVARVLQQNYSVIMDYPRGGIFLNQVEYDMNKSLNPLYVNSVTFGRFAILVIFSSASYDSLKTAFKASLTAKVVNGSLVIDADKRKIMEECEINLLVRGGKLNDVVRCVSGFPEFEQFIVNGGEYNRLVPGSPILFTANYASNNAIFRTSFTTEDD